MPSFIIKLNERSCEFVKGHNVMLKCGGPGKLNCWCCETKITELWSKQGMSSTIISEGEMCSRHMEPFQNKFLC